MHREKDKNHLTRSREGREERDVDRLPNNLLAASLRVFAPSREKGVHEPPITFLNDDRDAFRITPLIQNASRERQNHPPANPRRPPKQTVIQPPQQSPPAPPPRLRAPP